MRNGTFLTEALTQPSSRDSFTPLAAPFSRAWPGVEELTMFDWMNKPENKFRLMRFGNAMKGISGMTPDDAILRGLLAFFKPFSELLPLVNSFPDIHFVLRIIIGFDWTALPPDSVVIDVGGGVGAASLPIVRSCQNIKLVIQDTENFVHEAPKVCITYRTSS